MLKCSGGGVRFEKLNYVMGVVKQKSGHSKARTFCDILWCAARYGAGYYDYVMFGFYDMNGKQRDTYLTRVRNKKVCELMNQPGYGDEFDDKLRFNVRFADFLGRRTLNAAAATPDELSAFLQGLDCFFAKPSRGTCGNGIEKLRTADWPDAEKLLAYLKEKGLDVLEEPLAQHPDMAKLHPQSVNTMRIVTDNVNGNVTIAYIIVKMGTGGSVCDNSGQGGILARVDVDTGRISTPATDDYFHVYDTHPDTGIPLVGYQLPMVPEAIAMAKEAAQVFPQVGHVGWDMAVTPDGPAIIEGNNFPGTDLCQLAPLWPEKTGLWPYYKHILHLK